MKARVLHALKYQLDLYPELTLRDIYKSFFQDEYGPGHILENPAKARLYFDQELKSMTSQGRWELEPCGGGINFCRAPLDLVLDGFVDADTYCSIFLDGASGFKLPDLVLWKDKWETILHIIRPLGRGLKAFDRDAALISDILGTGQYAMHHSEEYLRLYDPHYRIVRVTFPLTGVRPGRTEKI